MNEPYVRWSTPHLSRELKWLTFGRAGLPDGRDAQGGHDRPIAPADHRRGFRHFLAGRKWCGHDWNSRRDMFPHSLSLPHP